MKKLILFIVLLLSVTISKTQNSSFIIGISGGANLSKLTGTGDFQDQGEDFLLPLVSPI